MKPQTRSSTSKIPNANTPRPSLLERGDAAARSGTSRSSGGVAGNLLFGTVNERILKECRDIYVNGDNGKKNKSSCEGRMLPDICSFVSDRQNG